MGLAPTIGVEMADENNQPIERFSKIVIEDNDGNEFELRYTTKQVRDMEKAGVTAKTISDHVSDPTLTNIEWVFDSFIVPAFHEAQPKMGKAKIRELWEGVEGKQDLISALIQLFMQPVLALTTDPTETRAKFRLV